MTHEDVQLLLATQPYSRMDEQTQRLLRAHLADCSACQEEARFDQFLEEELAPLRRDAVAGEVLLSVGGIASRRTSTRRSTRSSVPRASRRMSGSASSKSIPASSSKFLVWVVAVAAMVCMGFGLVWIANRTKPASPIVKERKKKEVDRNAPRSIEPLQSEKSDPQRVTPALEESSPEFPKSKTVQRTNVKNPDDAFDPSDWPLALIPESGVGPKLSDTKGIADIGKGDGKASLKPVSDELSDRDTLRLADGQVGLNLLESDLRILNQEGTGAGTGRDYLSVSMGKADASRLYFLGGTTLEDSPKAVEASDVHPIIAGGRYLLQLERGEQRKRYFLQVTAHQMGTRVDLVWKAMADQEAEGLVAHARKLSQQAAQVRAALADPVNRKGPGQQKDPGGVFAKPDEKKKSGRRKTLPRKVVPSRP